MLSRTDGSTIYEYRDAFSGNANATIEHVAKGFQPFVLDLLGNYANGLIYITDDTVPVRMYRSFDSASPVKLSEYLALGDNAQDLAYFQSLPISNPHGSAFADFNGDCKPELLLTSYDQTKKVFYFEFWEKQTGQEKYKLSSWVNVSLTVNDSSVISQPAIADFCTISDLILVVRKGTNDIIFYNSEKGEFYLIENTLSSTKKQSLTTVELCNRQGDPKFKDPV